MEQETKHLRIHGTVQGVSYRAWAQETAGQMLLTGWVRNVRMDRSVELVVTGYEDVIQKFISSCYSGPPGAHVKAIEIQPGIDEELRGFEIRDTV